MLAQAEQAIADCEIVCIEDYNKGAVTDEGLSGGDRGGETRNIEVLVDPAAIADYSKYAGATALKLNRSEAARPTGRAIEGPRRFPAGGGDGCWNNSNLEAAILTLDRHGAFLATATGSGDG